MKLTLHQTHHTIADFENIFQYLKSEIRPVSGPTVHLFPELFLTGYPLQDLILNKCFIAKYQQLLKNINEWSQSELKSIDNQLILIGGLKYNLDENGIPLTIENVVYELVPGEELTTNYSKILLPNYDIFDEKKYFIPGTNTRIINFFGKNIAILICEDMWPSSAHPINPVEQLKAQSVKIDLTLNLSASPYDLRKQDKRINRAKEISRFLGSPFAYVNRVGVEDEIIFDGASFVVNQNELLCQAKSFCADNITIDVPEGFSSGQESTERLSSTWEGLFAPGLTKKVNNQLPTLIPIQDKECEELIESLGMGVQEYAKKSHFNNFLVALSGGLDSALVLTLLKLNLREGQKLEAIYMPSQFSRDISLNLSEQLCKNLDIPFKILPISKPHNLCRELFKEHVGQELTGLSDENIQSRLRGTLIYARSNQTNSLVINTSNKSELAVGYSTIYGDSVGAISMLGDLYKSEVFELAKFINKKYNGIIPNEIITRPPSAELRDDQEDTDSLPPYERLDAILEGLLSYRLTYRDIVDMGFDEEEVTRVFNLYRKTEYKRSQFGPILKVKAKSFGFGYRVPLCKDSSFYLYQ